MNSAPIEFDVYDPSHAVAAGYWQMGHVRQEDIRIEWQSIANLINQGFPARKGATFLLTEPQHGVEFWGCIRRRSQYWMYRLLLAGRDNFGRYGRYFFVVFKADSPELFKTTLVSAVVGYLETQTEIPLNLQPLKGCSGVDDDAIPFTLPTHTGSIAHRTSLGSLSKKLSAVQEGSHTGWVMHNTGNIHEQLTFQQSGSTTGDERDILRWEPRLTEKVRELDQSISTIETRSINSNIPGTFWRSIPLRARLLLLIMLLAIGAGIGSVLVDLHRIEARLDSINSRLTRVENADALQLQQNLNPGSAFGGFIDSVASPLGSL
jgi:hypothetical protein